MPELSFVETAAMRAQLAAAEPMEAGRWADALAQLASADALQRDTTALVFRATTRAQRSVCLLMLGRTAEAERDASDALEWWPENPFSRFTIAQLMIAQKRYLDAEGMLAEQIRLYPEDSTARELLTQLRAGRAGGAR
jgi:tetratricopeptide (TPR) repeat protein